MAIYTDYLTVSSTRADHLIYNLENYLIRLNSVYDRVLQVVNAVFHLCVSEEHVNNSIITTNYKVQHRKTILGKIKNIRKFIDRYAQARHTLIHKHSYLDVELRRIELFYLVGPEVISKDPNKKNDFKTFRANHLRDYISKKREEYSNINKELFILLNQLFALLWEEYERQKISLK